MAQITLSTGDVVLVDDDDVRLLSGYRWYLHAPKAANVRYAAANIKDDSGKRRTVGMHRLLMEPGKGFEVDHINGNGLDNRRSNLRIVTRRQNLQNQRKACATASRYRGVYRNRGRWCARITLDYKAFYLGSFASEEAAAAAYDSKAVELFGEYARLNLPRRVERSS